MKRVVEAFLASFLFHVLLLAGVILLAPRFENKPPETIEVTLSPSPQMPQKNTSSAKEKQVVRQALVPDKLKVPEDETLARFLSQQKQRVKQETQAANSGMTENRSNKSTTAKKTTSQQAAQKPEKQTNQPLDKNSKDGYRTVDISKELQELNQLNEGRSSVGEALPTDVKVGSFTALNTDRYLFYTFYARIEELVRYRWESRVQHAIDNFDRMTAINAGGRNWNTQVEFLLDRRGFLQKAMVMKESGIRSFDAAAIDAFKEARVFPNPPQEMIQDDGYIHLKYTFTVNYHPPVLVNRN